ncbi:cation:proton antiporter domain-containing protein [Salinarimonas soli]|uniref:Potassium transporter TrkA n=1 Tax=Salinarimonas soli TaxID=1638099 RepID=A0A5B2VII6_9HYPH|nr:cation:proton antiporter [Salinarimonas soli]KAA2238172.1 potassium transporter TrkA [Salinarimonas soli]
MAGAVPFEAYKETILFLATAGVVVPLFHRLRVSPVLGFLGAGALIGPFGLGRLAGDHPSISWFTITNAEEISHIAEFGVVFLLFTIGIELSWERLRTLRRLVFGLGTLQVVVSTVAIGLIAFAAGTGATAALLIGLALALSSTAIVLPVLGERRRLNAPAGRASFAVLLFQDLAVAPVLFAVTVLATDTGQAGLGFALALAKAALAVGLFVVFGRLALRPLFQLVAATRSPELFMAACLLVVIGAGLAAAFAGLSMALGAFIAGLLLAETEYRRAIEATIDPFKGLLLGVFFVSVGMGLNPAALLASPLTILAIALGLMTLKAGIVYALALRFRLGRATALEAGLMLGNGGEFAFVILGAALSLGVVRQALVQDILLVTTVTMIAIPFVGRLASLFERRTRARTVAEAAAEPLPEDETPRVVVAGFGRVGQLVADMLTRHGVPFIALDMDAARVTEQRRAGRPVYFGDSGNPEMLRRCGLATARALVVTLDSPRGVESVVAAAKSVRSDIPIVARARDARHATQLYEMGVDDAVPETIEASLQLSEAVLVDLGVPMGLVIASIHERRDEYRRTLRRPADAGTRVEAAPFQGRRASRG